MSGNAFFSRGGGEKETLNWVVLLLTDNGDSPLCETPTVGLDQTLFLSSTKLKFKEQESLVCGISDRKES